ncbi:hypothetical protein thsrh120_38710 [Rhizobium sp. No.120]
MTGSVTKTNPAAIARYENVAALGLGDQWQSPPICAPETRVPVGEYAPAFVLPRCDRGYLGLAELIGRPSVIHFYSGTGASWFEQSACLNALAPTLGVLGVALVGIICAQQAVVADHCKVTLTDFPVLSDWEPRGLVSRLYGFNLNRAAPNLAATYLIDGHGVVRWIRYGVEAADVDSATIIAAARSHLSRQKPLGPTD